ncbi:hypothetical protein ACFX2I_022714 [Malus domestica]
MDQTATAAAISGGGLREKTEASGLRAGVGAELGFVITKGDKDNPDHKSKEEEVKEDAESAEREGAEESSGDGVLTVGEEEYYPELPEEIKLYSGALSYRLEFSRAMETKQVVQVRGRTVQVCGGQD